MSAPRVDLYAPAQTAPHQGHRVTEIGCQPCCRYPEPGSSSIAASHHRSPACAPNTAHTSESSALISPLHRASVPIYQLTFMWPCGSAQASELAQASPSLSGCLRPAHPQPRNHLDLPLLLGPGWLQATPWVALKSGLRGPDLGEL